MAPPGDRRALCGAGRAASPSRSRPARLPGTHPPLGPRSPRPLPALEREEAGRPRSRGSWRPAATGPRSPERPAALPSAPRSPVAGRPGLGPADLSPAPSWSPRREARLTPRLRAAQVACQRRDLRGRAGPSRWVLGGGLRALWLDSDGGARRADRRPPSVERVRDWAGPGRRAGRLPWALGAGFVTCHTVYIFRADLLRSSLHTELGGFSYLILLNELAHPPA